jgi:glutaredoxin
MRLLVLMAMLLAWQSAQAGAVFRKVDPEGHVYYDDKPDEDAEPLKFSAPASAVEGASQSYETRRARQNFPVTLYASEKCGQVCQQARDFLKQHHIPYAEKIIKTQEELDELRKKSGGDTQPTLSVGKNWLNGFESGQWQGELEAAGYPK